MALTQNSDHSREVHHRLISVIAASISPHLPPTYRVAIEKRVYPEEIREGYLEIRDMGTGEVITAIEVLSPTNKRAGKGREAYITKREEILSSSTHLVEIDLLREGVPMPIVENLPRSHYRILVSRSEQRPRGNLYAFNLQQPIPSITLPLRPTDVAPNLALQDLLTAIYAEARYDLAIDYQQEPIPALSGDDRSWCHETLTIAGKRIS
jgi:Protein of unknown function (DUF4058)